jgi:hypothetical protein
MSKAIAKGLALFAIAVVGSGLPVHDVDAAGAPGVPRRWEYRVLTRQEVVDLGKKDLAAGLNKLGGEGWELVAIDAQYIFKRPNFLNSNDVETLKQQLTLAETDIEMRKERLAWSERMARKGFMSENNVQAQKMRLREAEIARDWAKRELDALLLPGRTKPPEKIPVPQK